MSRRPPNDGGATVALAFLRATLVAIIFVSEQLVDARQLADTQFFVVLGIAAAYSVAGIVVAFGRSSRAGARALRSVQPGLDVLLLTGLAYTSGGAFSDVRKAFFVIPLAAAFSERPRTTASWSLLAVAAFTVQAVIAGGHPTPSQNSWERVTVSQDLYLAWTAVASTMLALGLRWRTRYSEELAHSRQRLVAQAIESVERERTRLAGALHDSPVQNLIAARHDLRRAERSGDPDSFRRLHEAIDLTIAELREEIFGLHPHVLDHVGLRAALEQVGRRHARDSNLQVVVEVEPDVDNAHRQMLFALGRELLGNAARHARATEVRLGLAREAGSVVLVVSDDGCGIHEGRMHQAVLDGHIGLAAVDERVAALGGSLSIATAPGEGTSVRVTLPERRSTSDGASAASERHEQASAGAALSDRVTPQDVLRVSPA